MRSPVRSAPMASKTAHERLAAHVLEQDDMVQGDSAVLADDLLNRTVLPRLFRTLLSVEDTIKGRHAPSVDVLSEDVDLLAMRRLVSAALPD